MYIVSLQDIKEMPRKSIKERSKVKETMKKQLRKDTRRNSAVEEKKEGFI
jgi:hypothetical protein